MWRIRRCSTTSLSQKETQRWTQLCCGIVVALVALPSMASSLKMVLWPSTLPSTRAACRGRNTIPMAGPRLTFLSIYNNQIKSIVVVVVVVSFSVRIPSWIYSVVRKFRRPASCLSTRRSVQDSLTRQWPRDGTPPTPSPHGRLIFSSAR